MTDNVRQQAKELTAAIEEAAGLKLAEPSQDVITIDEADAGQVQAIRKRMDEIDIASTGSIIGFGSRAQLELQQISQAMLVDVKNKDVGPAGDALRQMVGTIRGFSVSELDSRRERSWWERLTGKAAPIANFMARYEDVQKQIDRITETLLSHETTLLKDIKSLDQLYEKTLDFYHELALYIAAGEAKLKELDTEAIPAREAAVEAAAENDKVLRAQELRDLRAARDDLERRVHDLKLTRQVTMQSLPSIRLVQENDKALVSKIGSTMANTIPLWRQQLAMAVTIARSMEAGTTLKQATDLTNELLTSNADALRSSSEVIRTQVERGVVDIESGKQANDALIATIDDALRIANEGRLQRVEAEKQLITCETELKQALRAAQASSTQQPG